MYACVYHELTVVSISMAWRVMSRIINQSCKNTVPEANSYKNDLLCHILACSGSDQATAVGCKRVLRAS